MTREEIEKEIVRIVAMDDAIGELRKKIDRAKIDRGSIVARLLDSGHGEGHVRIDDDTVVIFDTRGQNDVTTMRVKIRKGE